METLLNYFLWLWYDFIGYTECHQLAERTLRFNNELSFVCCRCSAMYTGYCISYIFIWLTGRLSSRNFPPKKVIIPGIFLSSLMFLDVGTVLFGLREGANDIRMITGFLAGASFTFLTVPIINRLMGKSRDERRVDGVKPYLYILSINLLAFLLIKTGWAILFWPFFIIIGSGLILDYINLNSIFLMLFLRIFRVYKSNVYTVILIAVVLTFIEKFALYKAFEIFRPK